MKATGMIRRVDDLGRIVIPKDLRRTLGIIDGTPMEIFVDGSQVILKKYDANMWKTLSTLEEQVDDMSMEMAPEQIREIRNGIRHIRSVLKEGK